LEFLELCQDLIWEWKEMKQKKKRLAKWQKEWLELEDYVDWNMLYITELLERPVAATI